MYGLIFRLGALALAGGAFSLMYKASKGEKMVKHEEVKEEKAPLPSKKKLASALKKDTVKEEPKKVEPEETDEQEEADNVEPKEDAGEDDA
jgi:hypothetical protein